MDFLSGDQMMMRDFGVERAHRPLILCITVDVMMLRMVETEK